MVCISGCDSAIIVKWSTCVCHAISHYSRNDTICFTIFYFLCNSIRFSNVVCWCSKIGASHTMVYMYITPLVAVLFAAVQMNMYRFNRSSVELSFCRSMVCEIGESKSSFYCRGTYIKIGKQITYDLLSYFYFVRR